MKISLVSMMVMVVGYLSLKAHGRVPATCSLLKKTKISPSTPGKGSRSA